MGSYGTFRIKAAYQFTVEHSVYVAEEFSGKGIGKLLLQQLIATAKEEGYHLMIGCIDADNSGSIAFHEKFGFEVTGHLKEVGFKFDRWLDLVLMQLVLK
ncbi:N-acetyltransferase family protein [Flavobacterium sp. 3HN19-14]|uniref:GNAT family N-acetyltransferase n=1 Tax=Flavobacterium sp. 3HN19-14 TaxID=3448133 RepID=UPI003EE00697